MKITTIFDVTGEPMGIGLDVHFEDANDERIDFHFGEVARAIKHEMARRRAATDVIIGTVAVTGRFAGIDETTGDVIIVDSEGVTRRAISGEAIDTKDVVMHNVDSP